jgi:deoxyribose-phosphate aldolase
MSNDELINRIMDRVLANRKGPNLGNVVSHAAASDHTHDSHDDCSQCGCGHCVSERPEAASRLASAGAIRLATSIGIGKIETAIAAMIDHTILKPNATAREIEQLCSEALEYGFYSVCVNPTHIARCRSILAGSNVKVCAVIGFPLGANTTADKAFEARNAEELGADETDMVINIGALKDNQLSFVYDDIAAVVNATSNNVLVKVILETAYLTTEEKIKACLLSRKACADFVKTSTGFGPSGASLEDVILMRHVVGQELGVKASGGIRDTAMAIKMLQAGATRLGTSASVKIVTGAAG